MKISSRSEGKNYLHCFQTPNMFSLCLNLWVLAKITHNMIRFQGSGFLHWIPNKSVTVQKAPMCLWWCKKYRTLLSKILPVCFCLSVLFPMQCIEVQFNSQVLSKFLQHKLQSLSKGARYDCWWRLFCFCCFVSRLKYTCSLKTFPGRQVLESNDWEV